MKSLFVGLLGALLLAVAAQTVTASPTVLSSQASLDADGYTADGYVSVGFASANHASASFASSYATPANKFLRAAPLVSADAFFVNRYGTQTLIRGHFPVSGAVYNSGFAVDRFGRPIDRFGRRVGLSVSLDRFGRPIDRFGRTVFVRRSPAFQVRAVTFRAGFGLSRVRFEAFNLVPGRVAVFQDRFVPGFGVVRVRVQ